MLKSGVYRIDLGNGWFYVGSTCDFNRRERDHRNSLERGDHCNPAMQNVYNKHSQFLFTVLGRYPVDQILEREQVLLDQYCGRPKCANMAPTAGNRLGLKHSDEARARISAAAKRMSPESRAEWIAKVSAAQVGKKKSPEHCAAISAARTGRKRAPFSPEWRAAMSAAQTARWARRRLAESAP